ncbi:MAG: S-layer homology domain-containing protein [Gammaproteobacteria bacterium]|nr:S-layer homology domain-containing protein [Gammaproteobacteria bacterium]MCP5425139.1 S-layer homology domain-containing protein [Gammaproteobacteria bacterium]MCP5459826.1 S-layer homology domain-containing protein [Gammaproteobacteria bacterium]
MSNPLTDCPTAIKAFLSLTCLFLALYSPQGMSGQIPLAWYASTSSDVGGYKLYYGESSGNYSAPIDIGNKTSYTLSNLTDGKTYYISVTAYDVAETTESGFSNEVSLFLPSPPVLSATDGTYTDKVVVTWNGVSGANKYNLYRCTSTSLTSCGTALSSLTGTTYSDTGAAVDTLYYYRVQACNGGGCSSSSSPNSGYRSSPNVTFLDVPESYWAWAAIEALVSHSITSGCGNGFYCPKDNVTRAQMAVFLLKSIYGGAFSPPPASGTVFNDVPATAFAAAWIEKLAADGITSGCNSVNYCPNKFVTRSQMAVLLLRAKYGASYSPPPASGTVFNDVHATTFAASWIEKLAADGITVGCGRGNFCPNVPLDRASIAVFLVRAFNFALATSATAESVTELKTVKSETTTVGLAAEPGTQYPLFIPHRIRYGDLPPQMLALLNTPDSVANDFWASADGARIVFASDAPNLVPGDTNEVSDVFLYDAATGQIRRISVDSQGQQANGPSYSPRMDGLGETIVFVSEADNLVNDDANRVADVFVYNVGKASTERVSWDEWGAESKTASQHPAIDGTGETIFYDRLDLAGRRQVYSYGRSASITELASMEQDEDGFWLNNDHPGVSADGQFLTYLEWPLIAATTPTSSTCRVYILDRNTDNFLRLACPEPVSALKNPEPVFSDDGKSIHWNDYSSDRQSNSRIDELEDIAVDNPLVIER